jgi:hypothetical protein
VRATTKYRIGAAVSAFAIAAAGFGLAGVTTAGATPADSTGSAPSTHATPAAAAAMTGTYKLYFNLGSGFVYSGALYLNADTSWSLGNYSDGGSYHTMGQTLGMSDFTAGYTSGGAWGVKVSGKNLGSASKPGTFLAANVADYPFYAIFLAPTTPSPHARSGGPVATAAARPQSSHATFPGTYDVFGVVPGVETVYNSDNTWSDPGYCNAGTYLSFKVKSGTKVTYTDIQGDEGCAADHLWMAKEQGASKLGTASKPGIVAEAALGGVYAHWYATLAP